MRFRHISSSRFKGIDVLIAVIGSLVAVLFAVALFFAASGSSSTSTTRHSFPMLSRPYTPPLQDNMDRIMPNRAADAAYAPNALARLRASSSASVIVPISVRPPVDKTYKQVGVITRQRADGADTSNADLDILPLMGQYLHDDKWRYFTMTGGVGNKLPVERSIHGSGSGGNGIGVRRKCTSEYGCGELYNDDVLAVPGFKDKFVANIYDNGTFY